MTMNNYPFLIGKWQDRITSEGWHLLRFYNHSEDSIFRIVYCAIGGCEPEHHVDILHEGFGCMRVPLGSLLPSIKVIPINLENALACIAKTECSGSA